MAAVVAAALAGDGETNDENDLETSRILPKREKRRRDEAVAVDTCLD